MGNHFFSLLWLTDLHSVYYTASLSSYPAQWYCGTQYFSYTLGYCFVLYFVHYLIGENLRLIFIHIVLLADKYVL